MSNIAISLENISKQYRLGEVSTGTLSHDLNRWWAKLRGKEDPYLKVGETNDRTSKGGSDFVWSLRDVSFDVNQGEVLGIIGRNGAGKSTLLKILSKVTQPTTGIIKVKGRIASLLEVGTGFHPELTGRENIFLNGAILGMTKSEIKRKFDEIVAFAGVERYVDTPVKRYSSGMYVRLAFAVAAHLEPEILIVDEVLAVGDAEFQKKCLGKMKDVSGEGRTVLFVSHNLPSLKAICNRGILLKNGTTEFAGDINAAIDLYNNAKLEAGSIISNVKYFIDKFKLTSITVNGIDDSEIFLEKPFVAFNFTFFSENALFVDTEIHFKKDETVVASYGAFVFGEQKLYNAGKNEINLKFALDSLLPGRYKVDFYIKKPMAEWYAVVENSLFIEINNDLVHPYITQSTIGWGVKLLKPIQ
jgi:lipopolysaccharide transport system ATP-binding protein